MNDTQYYCNLVKNWFINNSNANQYRYIKSNEVFRNGTFVGIAIIAFSTTTNGLSCVFTRVNIKDQKVSLITIIKQSVIETVAKEFIDINLDNVKTLYMSKIDEHS